MRDFLFGFTTTRNAAAIAPASRQRFHIEMIESDRQQTVYWSDHTRGGFDAILRRIKQRADGFSGTPNLRDLKQQFEPWLAFYREMKSEVRRKDIADLHSLAARLAVTPLVPSQRILLWDGVAENLWIRKKKAAVDAIRAIFTANLVLNALEDITEDALPDADIERDLRRMFDAKLVLPLPLENLAAESQRAGLSARQQQMLERAHDQIVAAIDTGRLISVRADLQLATARFRAAEAERRPRDAVLPDSPTGRTLTADLGSSDTSTVAAEFRPVMGRAAVDAALDGVASVAARAVLRPFEAKAVSLAELTGSLDDEIEASEQLAAGMPEDVEQAVFLAYGAEFTIAERIPKGALIVKTKTNRAGGFDLYLTYHHGRKAPMIIVVSGRMQSADTTIEITAEALETEEDKFQTFRLNAEPLSGIFTDVELELRTALPDAPLVNLEPIRVFTQVPHFDVPDLQEVLVISQQPPPLFGLNRLGMIEYRRVEQEVSCYVTGQVSRIENIPARTFKRRNSRSFSMTEVEQDVTQEISSEHQSETESVEKNEMQTQMEQTLREEEGKSFDFGAGVSIELPGTGSMTTEASFNFNSQSSREDATSQAIQIARSLTQKVQEKVFQKSTARRRSLSRKEFEDIVEQGFDNRMGEEHVVCVHRWVDKIMTNSLVNYGRMEVIEFEVPEPARQFISAQEQEQEEQEFKARRPKRPRKMGLHGPRSVTNRNYRRFAATYGIELGPPPRDTINIARAFADSMPLVGESDDQPSVNRTVAYNDIAVPEGYVAVNAWVEASYVDALLIGGSVFRGGGSIVISVGDSDFLTPSQFIVRDLFKLEGTVPVAVRTQGAGAFVVQVKVRCKRKGALYDQWQMQCYTRLMAAYRALKDEYDEHRIAHEEETERVVDLNPRFRKKVMERELKRICISMLADQLGLQLTADHYGAAPDGELPPINFGPSLDRHAELVRFLEQAVNWNLMSYIFYPYFYAKEDSWALKISLEATRDRLFSAFLSSGMGRVMVPIRPGFEAAFSYFLETGQPWFGDGFVMDSEDDLYLSLADEMSTGNEEVVIEDSWQTKLPTNHTIIQDAAAAMIAEGLPCEIDGHQIGTGNSQLGPVLPPSGEGSDSDI